MRQNFWYYKGYTMYNSGLQVYFYDSLQDCIQKEDSCIKNTLQLVIYSIRNAQDYHILLTESFT